MFSLHETTQRRVCRVAFLLLCVAPTLWTVAWIAHFYRPWRHEDWQRALSHRFHVEASVVGIASPRPGVTRLARVEIADLRSKQVLAAIESLRIEHQGAKIALGADRVELPVEQVKKFAESVETCFSAKELPAVDFHAKQLVVVSARGERFAFANLRLHSEVSKAGEERILLQADVEQGETKSTVQMVLENQRSTSGSVFSAKFDTQQGRVPAWLMAALVPSVERCAEATFEGKGLVQKSSAGSSGQLEGRFENVDFSQWIGPHSPYRVQGVGRLQLNRLEWNVAGVKRVQGQLVAERGHVDRVLLDRLVERVLCVPGTPKTTGPTASDIWQAFDELSCGFEINRRGMTLTGSCTTVANPAGCLLANHGRPILLQPEQADIPMSRIAQVLLPQPVGGWLPLTRQAIEMFKSLPVPTLVPPKVGSGERRAESEGLRTRR